MTLSSLGDSALVLSAGEVVDDATLARVQALANRIRARAPSGVVDVLPAFASVTVFYDVARGANYDRLRAEVLALAGEIGNEADSLAREMEIPVCYGGDFGPDLAAVAAQAGKSPSEAIALHRDANYRVQAIGFVPGFAYLGGLPSSLHAPRRATPRAEVPAGSVGIGGGQTGVYPLATPGGWNLIGRTPLRLFDPHRAEPGLLRAGDAVRFREIAAAEFAAHDTKRTVARHAAASSHRHRGHRDDIRVEVIKAGMLTTVQDLGRHGYRGDGVPASGGADAFALRLANLLVGNLETAATLELTLVGPELRFSRDTWIALGGAEFEGLAAWQPVRVKAAQTLRFGAARGGCRGYLAVAGGLDVPAVLGSRSTYLRAAFGGYDGRALRDGDVLWTPRNARNVSGHWRIDPRILPAYADRPATVRIVRGAQADEFGAPFFKGAMSYHVSPQSDRMGARLAGAPLARRSAPELRSAPVLPGTVQVPPDGQPIVLLADAQTLGGYPQAAHVISVDLPLVAQLRPGDAVRFVEVSLGEAHQLAIERERALALLRQGLAPKFT